MHHGEMETRVDEIAPDIFRLSTTIGEAAPGGFTFNQFLVRGDEAMLFHTGMRGLFPLVSDAVAGLVPLDRLRWIGFGHVEADECGAMNDFLAAAPNATVTHGLMACLISVNDMADRSPRPLADGEVVELGSHRLRFIPTPHVPHNWESGIFYEEVTNTLLCGDLFTAAGGDVPPLSQDDPVEPAMLTETIFHATSIGPLVGTTIRSVAELEPTTLALMPGSSFSGDGGAALRSLADRYDDLAAAPA